MCYGVLTFVFIATNTQQPLEHARYTEVIPITHLAYLACVILNRVNIQNIIVLQDHIHK